MTSVAVAVVGVSGCGASEVFENPYNTTYSAEEVAEAEARLRSWPSLEETEAQVTETMQRIADAVTAINPQMTWALIDDREELSCPGVYLGLGGWRVRTGTLWTDAVPFPEETWPATLQAIRDVAAEVGITEVVVRSARSGHYDVLLTSSDGRRFSIGSIGLATIVADTGCRLKAPSPGS